MANVKPSQVTTVSTHLMADWRFAGSTYVSGSYSKAVTEWQYMAAMLAVPGQLIGGYISPTVSSNNLTLAIKTNAGNDPSADEPVFVKIGGTMYTIASATSATKNAGTNWCNAGGAELAAKEIDYFAYVVYDSNSSAVALSFSRYPGGRLVSDFSSTTTNEKHLADYANFTSTDAVEVCGRFAATLSAAASYNWSVPTFTNSNLIQYPVRESRWLDWTPVYSCSGSLTYTSVTTTWAKYSFSGNKISWRLRSTGTAGGTASSDIYATVPWQVTDSANSANMGFGNAQGYAAKVFCSAGTPDKLDFGKYDAGNWTASGTLVINAEGFYVP